MALKAADLRSESHLQPLAVRLLKSHISYSTPFSYPSSRENLINVELETVQVKHRACGEETRVAWHS